jgi:hypothetical protein
MQTTDEPCRTLQYWSQVEALSAPDAEQHDERGDDFVITYVRGTEFPWQQDVLSLPHKHFVRFGIIPRRDYEAELMKTLEAEERVPDDTGIYADQKEFTFLGLFQTDETGLPQAGTLEMAAFAPAFAGLKLRKDLSFDRYQQGLTESFDMDCEKASKEVRIVEAAFLKSLTERAIAELGWTPKGLDHAPIAVVRTAAVKDERGRTLNPTPNPVNGFFFDDICKVLNRSKAGDRTGIVANYLAEPDEGKRIDCTTDESVQQSLTTDRMPDGRWPTPLPLTLMQQVAVNNAMAALNRAGGIFSVNGPPGTGKTTLLMDLVAGIVVERAKILCTFDDPSRAFQKRWEAQYQGMSRPTAIFALDDRLHGFSIVVASSNNGAVENITRELPNLSKLHEAYHDADYFKLLATELINDTPVTGNGDEQDEAEPMEAWGLISVPLGNKKNRNLFVNTAMAKEKKIPSTESAVRGPAPHNILRLLEEARGNTSWKAAREDFQAALTDVERIKAEISSVIALQTKAAKLNAAADDAEQAATRSHERLKEIQDLESAARRDLDDKKEEVRIAEDELASLREGRPGFLARLFHTKSFRAWQASWLEALQHQKACRARSHASRDTHRNLETEMDELPKRIAGFEAGALKKRKEAGVAEEKCHRAKGSGYVDFNDLQKMTSDERQQALPFSNDALHQARASLFLKAIALHKAFATTENFKRNLRRALEMIDGKAELRPVLAEAAPHLWETLFLLIPVVSTTFASFARTFSNLQAGRIGWLFIDEAGQAVPQHAVGAFYRSRRAIVVGDPLQVEPVINFNKAADAKLLELVRAPERYQSTSTSVQVLADVVNPSGEYLKEDIWVGSPLKVHRRCIEPMFSIANEIAYEGTMVLPQDKVQREQLLTEGDLVQGVVARPLLGPSRWFDMPGITGNRQNYIPDQGEMALRLIQEFMNNGWVDLHKHKGLPALYVISPFRSVAQEFRSLLFRTRVQWAPKISRRTFERWVMASVGTVHTFQGKERETVILLLGGSTDGAIRWAAGTPNVLNVAVTRAERRIYVVGDRSRWMRQDLARSLADRMPFVPGQPNERLTRVQTA